MHLFQRGRGHLVRTCILNIYTYLTYLKVKIPPCNNHASGSGPRLNAPKINGERAVQPRYTNQCRALSRGSTNHVLGADVAPDRGDASCHNKEAHLACPLLVPDHRFLFFIIWRFSPQFQSITWLRISSTSPWVLLHHLPSPPISSGVSPRPHIKLKVRSMKMVEVRRSGIRFANSRGKLLVVGRER